MANGKKFKNEGHHKFPIFMIGFRINTKQGDNENNVIVDAIKKV
jgi:hypothetical protein